MDGPELLPAESEDDEWTKDGRLKPDDDDPILNKSNRKKVNTLNLNLDTARVTPRGEGSLICDKCNHTEAESICKHLQRVTLEGCSSPGTASLMGPHFVPDSPLTPTRYRTKSEAETSTNTIHAQAVIGPSVRPKECRGGESPRGEPVGSEAGSLSLHGTVTRRGEMLSFVAEDFLEKIRRSTTPVKANDRGSSSATSSAGNTPSSSYSCTPTSTHSRTPSLSPSGISSSSIPPVDPSALMDIERHCRRVADSVDLMMGHLSSTLQNMSAITVGHTQTYRDAVEKAGITVDQNVKCMYALIAKCEALNKTMEPVYQLAIKIKSIRRLLEEMEMVWK